MNKLKKILSIIFWSFSIIGLITIMGFINISQKNAVCNNVEIKINYDHENFFVEKKDINSIIIDNRIQLKGKPFNEIDYEHLEKMINANPSVAKAEVYSTIAGNLKINIFQRKPIIRIMSHNPHLNFYIDEEGEKMPLSSKYTSRVLLATGNIKTTMLEDLFRLAKHVDKNKFWKAQVQQIHINLVGEIVLIPRVGKHKIIFGGIEDMEQKFEKLMIFYKRGLKNVGWNKYKTINLKYKNQIVCTKN